MWGVVLIVNSLAMNPSETPPRLPIDPPNLRLEARGALSWEQFIRETDRAMSLAPPRSARTVSNWEPEFAPFSPRKPSASVAGSASFDREPASQPLSLSPRISPSFQRQATQRLRSNAVDLVLTPQAAARAEETHQNATPSSASPNSLEGFDLSEEVSFDESQELHSVESSFQSSADPDSSISTLNLSTDTPPGPQHPRPLIFNPPPLQRLAMPPELTSRDLALPPHLKQTRSRVPIGFEY